MKVLISEERSEKLRAWMSKTNKMLENEHELLTIEVSIALGSSVAHFINNLFHTKLLVENWVTN